MEKTAALRGYMLYKDPKYIQMFADLNKNQEANLEAVAPLLKTDKSKEYLAKLKEKDNQYNEVYDKIVNLIKAGNMNAAMAAAEEGRQVVTDFKAISLEWDAWVDKINEETKQKIDAQASRGRTEAYTVSVIAIAVGIILGIFLSRSISRPVNALAAAAGEIANGNLTVNVPEVKTKDEIKDLANAFGVMVKNLRDLLHGINSASQTVAATSEELSSNAEEATKATQQVSKAIEQVAKGSTEQARSITDTVQVMTQVSQAIEQIAAGAQEQNKNVVNTTAMVNEMANKIDTMAEGMETVKQVAEQNGDVAAKGGQAVDKTCT